GGIGQCGGSGGRELGGESVGTCAEARTQSHIGWVPPLRVALARRRSVTSAAGPTSHFTLPTRYLPAPSPARFLRCHGFSTPVVGERVCAWRQGQMTKGKLGAPLAER